MSPDKPPGVPRTEGLGIWGLITLMSQSYCIYEGYLGNIGISGDWVITAYNWPIL